MQAFLELVAAGRVAPSELMTHRFPVDEAPEAYRLLTDSSVIVAAMTADGGSRLTMFGSTRRSVR